MVKIEEALALVLETMQPLGKEEIPLSAATGRVLAADAIAAAPNPAWDYSGMDGYALRAVDTKGAASESPVRLKVIYDLPAGVAPKKLAERMEAVRIMTGAIVPEGADAVVAIEETTTEGGFVLITSEAEAGQHIRRRGSDFAAGEHLLSDGILLGPSEIAVLAAIGMSKISVYKMPSVAVISTGDELAEDGAIGPGRVPDSSGPALSAFASLCGASPVNIGIARSSKESVKVSISKGLESADCVVISGGVSVGDYDFVKEAIGELGGELAIWRVAMKPGKSFAFGLVDGKPVFGLPGNPVSSLTSFEAFVRPALLKMSGRTDIFREVFFAELTEEITQKPGRRAFLMAVLRRDGNVLNVTPLKKQGSGMLSSLIRSNSLIVVPEETSFLSKGDIVKVIPLSGFYFRTTQIRTTQIRTTQT